MINLKKIINKIINYPPYKVALLEQDENGNYIVTVQIVRNGLTFDTTPEKILSSDHLTDKFSPRDIRTLTYLGYLEINSPKYKIMAKKLAENDELILVLREKKKNKVETKLSTEIANDIEFLKQFDSTDAHFIGYIQAIQDLADEKKLKLKAKENMKNQTKEGLTLKINENTEYSFDVTFFIDNERIVYREKQDNNSNFLFIDGDISLNNGELYKAIKNHDASEISVSCKKQLCEQILRKRVKHDFS